MGILDFHSVDLEVIRPWFGKWLSGKPGLEFVSAGDSRIHDFLNARSHDDFVVVYFSGHGLLDSQGRLYFAARDTQPTRLASTGLDAQKAVVLEPPAVIVLDLLMPDMSGFEFLDWLRKNPVGRAIPVIVWTVKDLSSDERAQLAVLAQGVVQKGAGTQALLDELRALLPPPVRAKAPPGP